MDYAQSCYFYILASSANISPINLTGEKQVSGCWLCITKRQDEVKTELHQDTCRGRSFKFPAETFRESVWPVPSRSDSSLMDHLGVTVWCKDINIFSYFLLETPTCLSRCGLAYLENIISRNWGAMGRQPSSLGVRQQLSWGFEDLHFGLRYLQWLLGS